MAKSKKTKEIKPMKDRFLTGQRQDFSYLTYALYCVLFIMSALLVFVYLVGMCQVRGPSMNPTLYGGERLLMWNHPISFNVGDIVTFAVEGEEGLIIKRVIGVSGDEIVFVADSADPDCVELWRRKDGEERFSLVEEDYILEPMKKDAFKETHFKIAPSADPDNLDSFKVKIDPGMLLLLGDNRNDSKDSREFGLVPTKNVSGKMFYALEEGSVLERLLRLIYTD